VAVVVIMGVQTAAFAVIDLRGVRGRSASLAAGSGACQREGPRYFWATHAGAEIDLLVVRGRTRLGFEIKRTTAPTVTRSMRIALET